MGQQLGMFYNTTGERGEELIKATEQARNQTELVLGIFKEYPTADFTPWEVLRLASHRGHKMMITSVRRSITNLTGTGELIKTGIKRIGDQKASNYTWKLKH